jgi:hypothetical protein
MVKGYDPIDNAWIQSLCDDGKHKIFFFEKYVKKKTTMKEFAEKRTRKLK